MTNPARTSTASTTAAFKRVVTFVLAGGRGERLLPLTRDRSKPSVPFGGAFRVIDFPLSNCINSGFRKIYILTQFLSQSLYLHLKEGWNLFHHATGDFIHMVPAQQRSGSEWYRGTADAVFQNLNILDDLKPEFSLILSGDHVYKMNYREMFAFHIDSRADVTVAVKSVPRDDVHGFGVLTTDEEGRIRQFVEKPKSMSDVPESANPEPLINMGIYLFSTPTLVSILKKDASLSGSSHDFGRDILPTIIGSLRVMAYPFDHNTLGTYWKDIGTIESYFEANFALIDRPMDLDLYQSEWPIRTFLETLPPSLIRQRSASSAITESIVSHGCMIADASLNRAILSPQVTVHRGATVESSILFSQTTVGENARIRNAIIDKGNLIPPGMEIGFDLEKDRRRFSVINDRIVVVPKRSLSG